MVEKNSVTPPVTTPHPTPTPTNAVAKVEQTQSERFTAMVIKEFGTNAGELNLGEFHKKLCQNYFIKLDSILKETDAKNLAKQESKREPLAYTWANVNMQKLSLEVVAYASMGIDPMQANHINLIPYKNKATNKYDIGFLIGYKGIEIKARKFGLDNPDIVVVEVVFSNDEFAPTKKDVNNRVESYIFNINNPFDRGNIVGGFYYHAFTSNPEKNKIKCFSMKEIEKRKPKYASVEFWGGEKDKWVDGKKQGTEKVDGWLEEMVYKTIHRAAYGAFTIDSEKINTAFNLVIAKERELKDDVIMTEIATNANKKPISFDDAENIESIPVVQPLPESTPKKEVQIESTTATEEKIETGFSAKEMAEIEQEEAELAIKQNSGGPGFN